MSDAASKDAMNALHAAVAAELNARIASREASAADISNAIKFLKDNGIEARADKNPGLGGLARHFPTFDADEDHSVQ